MYKLEKKKERKEDKMGGDVNIWLILIISISGLLLMTIEFFIPGFGIFGVSGIAMLILSILMLSPSLEVTLASFTVAIIMSLVLGAVAFKFIKKSSFWKKIVLQPMGTAKEQSREIAALAVEIGMEGKTITKLRPSGHVLLDNGQQVSVVTDGHFIDENEKILVSGLEGNRIVVKRIEEGN